MIRVGIDAMSTLPPIGGVGRYVAGLLHGLREIERDGLEVTPLIPRCRRSTSIRVLLEMQLRTRRGFDAVHFPFYYPPLRPFCPVTVAVHDVLLFEHPEWFPRAWGAWMRFLIARGLRAAAAVVTGSRCAAESIAALGLAPPKKVHVIPYGVDRSVFAPPTRSRVDSVLRAAGLERPYVVQFGGLEPRRGLDLSIAAVREARVTLHDLELVLAGRVRASTPGLESPPSWLRSLGEVADADAPALLAGACAVLAPSRGEGFDLPVLEALACGAAVVASDIQVHRELFSGATAEFASGNAADLARALVELVTRPDLRDQLRAQGLDLASRFSWAGTARGHADLWLESATH